MQVKMWRGKYTGNYQNRFVSSKSSGTSSMNGLSFFKPFPRILIFSDGQSMNSVPPPAALTVGNSPVPPPTRNVFMTSKKEMEMKKEQEVSVFYFKVLNEQKLFRKFLKVVKNHEKHFLSFFPVR